MINTQINKKDRLSELLVKIPSGEISLRDDRTKQKWNETIDSFYLSKYLVTQDLFQEVTNENPSTFKGSRRPVETVSWLDSVRFCNALSANAGLEPYYLIDNRKSDYRIKESSTGYRLPTDAEWEYACKAGLNAPRYGKIEAISWYKDNSNEETHEIGLKEPNDWGLFDMLGNVWEWCSDIYDESVYGSYRVIRGGGWNDEERGCLATNRRRSHPTAYKIDDLGFRIARNLK
ncbi:formylglycine-generating enzyme family protein [uncultured Sunxiuqinia sp.]|uniref:formylglycine-generating enzyme family protein n=1 Tax=uncultured Sunxiuqinia sp. TaxID=1573825 RepID=UPI002AA7B627|nr:formylglycine-generating enzyme family protein [uncultured Sunxiuqinia sp.]